MYGGLWKTASAAAILAAAGAFGASSAKAADLGGDCCADLEERVAELEATTVRKGNRKVSVTLSGFVGMNVMWWNDGTQNDTYIGDGGNYFSRFRFVGSAKISPTLTAGFLYEFGANTNSIGSMNQLNGGDGLGGSGTSSNAGSACGLDGSTAGCAAIRDSTVWLRDSRLGMVKVGHGSTATDNLVLIDLGGMAGAGTPDYSLYMGGFLLRGDNGVFQGSGATWAKAITGHESWDTSRRDHILYETPTIAGFTVQAALAEDNYWDVALRYAGEFGGFRLAFGVGYQEDTKFNSPAQTFGGNTVTCIAACDAKSSEIKGSASILHVPTGLFLTGAAGNRDISGTGTQGIPDANFWYLAGGIRKNFFGFGDTVLFGEYSEHKNFLAEASFFSSSVGYALDGHSKVTEWGLGVNQYIDAAAMEVFLTYKHFEIDAPDFTAPVGSLADFDAVIGGARINF